VRGADEASPLPPVRVRFKLAIPRREVSMRIARPRYEPDPNGINDPLILRDRLYAELRSVHEQCQKLAIAPTSPRSMPPTVLPLDGPDECDRSACRTARSRTSHAAFETWESRGLAGSRTQLTELI
jgi:hypothetical protein